MRAGDGKWDARRRPEKEMNVSCEASTTASLGLGCPVHYEKRPRRLFAFRTSMATACWRVSVVRVEFLRLGKKDPLPPPIRGEDSLLVVSTCHPSSARPASSPVRVSPSSSCSPLFLHTDNMELGSGYRHRLSHSNNKLCLGIFAKSILELH